MKLLLKKFSFWFLLIGILIVLINLNGQDDKNILLIGLNPILNKLVYLEEFRPLIWNEGPINEGPKTLMYIVALGLNLIYGLIIDIFVSLFKIILKGFEVVKDHNDKFKNNNL